MVRFQHTNADRVRRFAHDIVLFMEGQTQPGKCMIIGPNESPLSKMKNYYRWQVVMKSENLRELQRLLRLAQDYLARSKSNVQLTVDMDPTNLW